MSDLIIRSYIDADATAWDRFCTECGNATFLHTRRFLSYHGDRFRDRSCIVEGKHGWLAILPAAEHPSEGDCVVSHPGISYGGLIHAGALIGDQQLAAFTAIAGHYRQFGYRRLRYKAVPHIYQMVPAQDDLYSLFRLGARLYRCDLSSSIDLTTRRSVSERRRRGLRKAIKAGLQVCVGNTLLPEFWSLLTENLARRHDARPVHTLAEIVDLANRFPNHIQLVGARHHDELIGGVLLFCTARVHHAQYIAASEAGNDLAALDLVFDHCITTAGHSVRYFDFGISNEDEGRILNSGLYAFKTEFGGGGTVAEFYEVDLMNAGYRSTSTATTETANTAHLAGAIKRHGNTP
jgi:hypothetical protein